MELFPENTGYVNWAVKFAPLLTSTAITLKPVHKIVLDKEEKMVLLTIHYRSRTEHEVLGSVYLVGSADVIPSSSGPLDRLSPIGVRGSYG